MADVFTPEKRSEVMSRIRGRDTKPELALRSMLHRLGYRFTVNGPKNLSLPGKPDLVLPKYQIVIFVHGCFWHGHPGCPGFRLPKSRRAWWQSKILGNQSRDIRNECALRDLGWHVVTIWECALKNSSARLWLINRIPDLLGQAHASIPDSLPMVAEDATPYGKFERAGQTNSIPSVPTIDPSGNTSTSTTYSSKVTASSKSRSPSMNSCSRVIMKSTISSCASRSVRKTQIRSNDLAASFWDNSFTAGTGP